MVNYFELYNLPVGFYPDQQLVKQKFYELSKKYHPDFYINESEEKQQEVLEFSTLNNKAFQVLKDPKKVLPYVLTLKNELLVGENYTLPQSFLMDMMDINETLMDLELEPNPEKLAQAKTEIASLAEHLTTELDALTLKFEQSPEGEQERVLKAIKDNYYRSKYLARINEGLQKMA